MTCIHSNNLNLEIEIKNDELLENIQNIRREKK
jgi:hypothetical protein